MKKIIIGSKISFYNNEVEIFNMDFISDEFVIKMNTNEIVEINQECEAYEYFSDLFKYRYDFGENYLGDIKSDNELVWHSDCFYNPEDEWSIKSISCLHIIFDGKSFKLWCNKPIDEEFNKVRNYYCICFSPSGNGKFARNIDTGLSLQDDFVIHLYQKLNNRTKVKKLS